MAHSLRLLDVALLALGMAAGCRQVIGIDDANVDPGLGQATDPAVGDSGGTGDTGGTGGTGGSDPGVTGGTGGDPGTAGGSAGSAGSDAPNFISGTLCERYCGAVTQNCTGAFAVYANYDNCLAVCALLPEGMEGETEHNTVGCRLTAALFAPTEVAYYCPAAGPGGNGVCGTDCEGYCKLLVGVCSAYSEVELKYDECKKSCAELPDLGTYTVDPTAELYEGNHVQCRLYHVSAAATGDTEAHCQHALGASPCN